MSWAQDHVTSNASWLTAWKHKRHPFLCTWASPEHLLTVRGRSKTTADALHMFFSCMTVRDEIPERRRRLRARWWERQTWRRGRGSSAAAWGSCTSPSTARTSRRCSPTEPWPPRSGSGLLVNDINDEVNLSSPETVMSVQSSGGTKWEKKKTILERLRLSDPAAWQG